MNINKSDPHPDAISRRLPGGVRPTCHIPPAFRAGPGLRRPGAAEVARVATTVGPVAPGKGWGLGDWGCFGGRNMWKLCLFFRLCPIFFGVAIHVSSVLRLTFQTLFVFFVLRLKLHFVFVRCLCTSGFFHNAQGFQRMQVMTPFWEVSPIV